MPESIWVSLAIRPPHWSIIPCWAPHYMPWKPRNIPPFYEIASPHPVEPRLRPFMNWKMENSVPSSKMPCGSVIEEAWKWEITIPMSDPIEFEIPTTDHPQTKFRDCLCMCASWSANILYSSFLWLLYACIVFQGIILLMLIIIDHKSYWYNTYSSSTQNQKQVGQWNWDAVRHDAYTQNGLLLILPTILVLSTCHVDRLFLLYRVEYTHAYTRNGIDYESDRLTIERRTRNWTINVLLFVTE